MSEEVQIQKVTIHDPISLGIYVCFGFFLCSVML
jgi:hypothetical protein